MKRPSRPAAGAAAAASGGRYLQLAAAVVVFGTAAAMLLVAACQSVPTVAPPGTLRIFANPASVPLRGEAELSILAFETSGQPVPDDTLITLTTTLGRVEPAEPRTRGGFAAARFVAGDRSGSAEVTARSGSASSATVTIQVGSTATSISVTASPASLPGGGGSSTVTARLLDGSGTPVAGANVVFSTDNGSMASLGRAVATDSTGRASDVLTTSEDAKVTATLAAGGVSGWVFVDVEGSGASSLSVSAEPSRLSGGADTSIISATVTDSAGAAVGGYPLAFQSTAGELSPLGTRWTDARGVATATLRTTRTATVTATGPALSGSVRVEVAAATPAVASFVLTASPVSITKSLVTPTPPQEPACGDPTGFDITLEAKVLDSQGVPVTDQLVVFYTAAPANSRARVPGRFCEQPPQARTDSSGIATIHYTISAAERQQCDAIQVPCQGGFCSPCTPTPTPTATPTPPTHPNNCCCGIVFAARLGNRESRAPLPAFRVYADGDCVTKQCGCTF